MSINLRIDEELHAELKEAADEEDRSVVSLVRQLIRRHLAERKQRPTTYTQPELPR